MKNLIPHQLHLTDKQINSLTRGGSINIPHHQMGSGAGNTVVLLHPQNARKILSAYKKGKGMRLNLGPDELKGTMIQGRGFKSEMRTLNKGFKENGRTINKGFKDIGKDISRGFNKKVVDSGLGKRIASELIDVGANVVLPAGLSAVGGIYGGPAGALAGDMAGQVIGDQLDKYAERKGYGAMNMKEKMARLRSMRKTAKAGEGLYKTLHKAGIKNPKQKLKAVGKATAKVASQMAGDAITAYTGNPMLGESVARIADETAERMIDKGVKNGLKHGAKMSAREAKRMAIEAVDDYADEHLPPEQKKIVENALAGKYKNAKDLIYDVADVNPMGKTIKQVAQTYDTFSGIGLKRGRGRPRKDMIGTGVAMSRAYKKALKANYSGLELNNVANDNKPVSQYKVNPRVKPSSEEMTLSPYQSSTSPAMNPFVPTNYFQEGGQMKGYGGSGLYLPSGNGLY
jgi:hypothetical protein